MGDEVCLGNKLVGRVNYPKVNSIAAEEFILLIFHHKDLFAALPRELKCAFASSFGFHVELLMDELECYFVL